MFRNCRSQHSEIARQTEEASGKLIDGIEMEGSSRILWIERKTGNGEFRKGDLVNMTEPMRNSKTYN